MLAGIPFGVGFLLIFMVTFFSLQSKALLSGDEHSSHTGIPQALLNYLTDAYQIFAASAMAAASCCRSVFGALLPLAGKPMYDKLGIAWASSLLGFLSLGMSIIPFAFIKYGDRIRANSKFCQYLAERKKTMDDQEEGEKARSGGPEKV